MNILFKKRKFDYVINCGSYVEQPKKRNFESHYKGNVNLYKIFKNKNIKLFIQ